jgi:hypothetical protein
MYCPADSMDIGLQADFIYIYELVFGMILFAGIEPGV